MELLHGLKTALAGRYEIEREIGRGGMATVYLARDVKHYRSVALKVLDPELGAVLGVERFLSEIRVTANLQHPNLLPLFDSGEADGLLYYVMPYVEGESLRHRLTRERQLPIADAVHIATAIATALDLAHRNGVIHRDLKPENILLREGEPVIADFGIALAVSNAGGTRVTQTGLSLGTPQYMSPEQATGDRIIDGRADIYALGAVLYEMLTGEPPHSGTTAQAVIAKLMTEQPRSTRTLRHSVPPSLDAAVLRALEKLPADRFATARDFADALHRQDTEPVGIAAPGTPRQTMLPWAIAALSLVVAGGAVAAWWRHRTPPELLTTRFMIGLNERDRVAAANGIPFAVSPDGRYIVYAGQDSNTVSLMIRRADEIEPRVLVSNVGLQPSPAISPDGKWIAYADAARIERIPVDGGQPTPIAPITTPVAGIAWLGADTIVASLGGIVAIPINGGTPRIISKPDSSRGEAAQWGPHLSDDHKRIFYISVPSKGVGSSLVASVPVSGGKGTISDMRGTTVLGSRHGHVLWVTSAGDIVAVPERDVADKSTTPTTTLLEGVLVRPGGAAKAAMSDDGSLVYISGDNQSQLVSVAMNGGVTPLTNDVRVFLTPRWSPDGNRVVTAEARSRYAEIWVHDIKAGTSTRLTANGSDDVPEWSPDGKRIIYRSRSAGSSTIRWISADNSGEQGELLGPSAHPFSASLTPDGKTIVYRTTGEASVSPRVMVVPVDGSAPARPVAPSEFAQFSWRRSPNGRYVAFNESSNEQPEVYVRAIDGGPKVQISAGGGMDAVWMPDGNGLYYWRGRTLIAARFTQTPALTVTDRKELFSQSFPYDPSSANYDVSPDGTRFVMVRPTSSQSQTIVVLGWDRELRKRLGVK